MKKVRTGHRLATLALAALVGACIGEPRPDGAVYAAVLSEMVLADGWSGHPDTYDEQRPVEQLVIFVQPGPQAPDRVSGYARGRLEAADPSAIADFEERADDVSALAGLDGVGPYRLIDEADVSRIFQGEARGGWQRFYREFPGAPGMIFFSGVGFSADRRQAIVYMGSLRGGEWGDGSMYLLERQRDGWAVVDRVSLWQS